MPTADIPPNLLSRRTVLRASSVIGAGALIGAGPLTRVLASTAGASTSTANTVADCTMIVAGEIGPYFVDGQLNRSDVRTDSATGKAVDGVPLKLTLTFDEGGCNAPLVGARVDIWSANPEGVYSDEQVENTLGDDSLRGYQITDSTGTVTFTTLYPGWYAGRTTHIHARIRTYSGSTVTSDFITQYFFDATSQSAILTKYASLDSTAFQARDTDHVYLAEVAEGGADVLTITGSVTDGYAASYTGEINPTITNTGGTPDTTVSASLISATTKRVSRTRRHVTVKYTAGEKLTEKAVLVLDKKVVAQTAATVHTKGNHTVVIAINNSVGHGTAEIYLACKDTAGNYKNLSQKVRLPH